jgi:hypothetical protein
MKEIRKGDLVFNHISERTLEVIGWYTRLPGVIKSIENVKLSKKILVSNSEILRHKENCEKVEATTRGVIANLVIISLGFDFDEVFSTPNNQPKILSKKERDNITQDLDQIPFELRDYFLQILYQRNIDIQNNN